MNWDMILNNINWPEDLHIFLEVSYAMFLGGLIGWERELSDKPAGLRTHILVCASATLLVGLGNSLIDTFTFDQPDSVIRADPMRIFEAIVVGISFLGAGTIIRRNESGNVQGLTTAASILLTAAIGIAVAVERYVLAFAITMLALVILHGLRLVSDRLGRKEQ